MVEEEEDHNHKEVMQVFLVLSHSLQHTQQQAAVVVDQDYKLDGGDGGSGGGGGRENGNAETLYNHKQIQVLLNMEMTGGGAAAYVGGGGAGSMVNHIQIIQADQDGVELEDKHHQHSKILMQDMVEKHLVVTQVD